MGSSENNQLKISRAFVLYREKKTVKLYISKVNQQSVLNL